MLDVRYLQQKAAIGQWTVAFLVLASIVAMVFVAFLSARKRVIQFSMEMRQHAMFLSVESAIELFNNEFGGYPPSDANDTTGSPYCGAMELTEAMIGWDQMGFHPASVFRADGMDLYTRASLYTPDTLKARLGLLLPLQNTNVQRLADVYGKGGTGPFREDMLVMCDIFERDRSGGKRTGMPVLYYRADTSATLHDVNDPGNPQNIYDYKDNQALIKLGVPGKPGQMHPFADPRRFYLNTRNERITDTSRPVRANSYILISAGRDGLYGTADDICNFNWTYRER